MGMRVWIENGTLKVYIGKEKTFERGKLLSETWQIDKSFIRGEPYTMVVLDQADYVSFIRKANKWGAEISNEAQAYVAETERKEREAYERKKEEERQESVLKRAEILLSKGCGLCPNLDSKNRLCTYANAPVRYKSAELEQEFEDWKESRATKERRFFATAYPCQGCKTIVEANKILQKEKEDGKQANL